MKRAITSGLLIVAAAFLSSCAKDHTQQQTALESPAYVPTVEVWPVRFEDDSGNSFTVFEPQYDSWDGHQLTARSAVSVQSPNHPEATYGVFGFSAITLVDKSARTVTLANFRVTSVDFPSARDQTQNYLASLVQNFPKHSPALPLDHLETALAAPTPPKSDHLNNTPPRVIIATKPAVLVYIDGTPAWRTVPATDLQRVINTRMLVLKDSAGRCYLHLFDGYLQAASLDGPWTVTSQPPPGVATAEKQAADAQVDLLPGTPDPNTQKTPSLSTSPVPDVFVSTQPAELIQFKGAPEYAAIPDTHLVYVSNTSGNVFKSLTDQENYILISGRWYKASSLDGPWHYIPGNELPKDFANIPDSSPKENVKASVPGTRQAEEALIANSIPQSTAVPRTSQMPAPQLDGPVQLAPIEGTPLHYVVNSSTPIIQEDPQSWYACSDGVWYTAASADGPWTAATFVPPVIYTIPASSPLHYVTYVQVYGANTNAVYEGYTPGYLGTEVDEDGTVVYGTGYYYGPWVGTVWYGPPVTWGWGFYDCWSPWWGWGYGCGFGWGWAWGWGFYPPYPYWSGFHRGYWYGRPGWWHGAQGVVIAAHTSVNVYHQPGHVAASHGFGQAYNSRTGWLQAGQQARVQHVSGAAWQRFAYNQNSGFYRTAPGAYGGWNNHSYGAPGYGPNRGYSGGNWHGGYNWNSPAQGQGRSQVPAGGGGYHGGGGSFGGGGGFHGGGGGGGGGSHGGGGGGGGGHGGR